MAKICSKCGTESEEIMFASYGKYTNGKTRYKNVCKECDNQRRRALSIKHKELWLDLFEYEGIELKCQHCGFGNRKLFAALDFHHLDPDNKTLNVSDVMNKIAVTHKKVKTILDEIKSECIVLCSNCHRLFHAGQITLGGK